MRGIFFGSTWRFRNDSDEDDGEAHEEAQRLPPRVLLQQIDLCQLQRARNVLEVGPRAGPAVEG